MKQKIEKLFKFGSAIGTVIIPPEFAEFAKNKCIKFFEKQIASDYSESVDSWAVPNNFSKDWIPHEDLEKLGFKVEKPAKNELVMTTSVGHHIDCIHGMTLALVISNPGFKFNQKGHGSHEHKVGQWFIFDDRISHSAEAGKNCPEDGVYAIWSMPIENI